jgi:hypothetical protein
MSMMFGEIACIKPSRQPGEVQELTLDRMRTNQDRGISTQLVPDCNVVIDMIIASSPQESLETTRARNRLQPLMSFLRSSSENGLTYHISPFFGLNEMPRENAVLGIGSLDSFSTKFDLNWIDAQRSVVADRNSIGLLSRGFQALDQDLQCVLSLPYSALLLMLVVSRDLPCSKPLVRFRHFLRLYRRLIDVISIREITIARFVFAPEPDPDSDLRKTWEKIVSNFTGRNHRTKRAITKSRDLDRTSLNGAFDLFLLNSALISDYCGLQGEAVDTWVLTADAKLAALTDAVYHSDMGTGQTGLFVVTEDYQDQGDYWRETHQDMQALGFLFRAGLKPSPSRQRARALGVLALAEQGLHGTIPLDGDALRFSGTHWVNTDYHGVLVTPTFHSSAEERGNKEHV